jgi:hypothetical protein
MNGFEKAVNLIEGMAAANGGYPESVVLVKFRSRQQFERLRRGEDFGDHQQQTVALKAWCARRGIMVEERLATNRMSARDRAEAAARPYRLGLNIHGSSGGRRQGETPLGAIGWFTVQLGSADDHGGEL